ncbi:MAG TPA: hypothetical protein VHV75_08555 [Solirubrobacteraceae bacterium]|jgi:hypothetical protein|nr:hypothetical protein [Solirubrobacteraceae bacterium]
MFHVEMRMGIDVVREFNLSEQDLWTRFLGPLMADREFVLDGHDFTPRKTRIKIFDGPQLRPDQLGLGRGWQNVERGGSDITEAVLARAREHVAVERTEVPAVPAPDALRERLIGRLSAGPVSFEEITDMVAEVLPGIAAGEQLAAGERAALELLRNGGAQLAPPSGR